MAPEPPTCDNEEWPLPLATPQDISIRLGRALDDDELARVQAYIEDATALVVDHCTKPWDADAPPAVFKTAVCSEVIRWLTVTPGTVMEKTGDLEVEYAQTANTSGLSQAAKSMLSKYRKRVTTIPLTRSEGSAVGTVQ